MNVITKEIYKPVVLNPFGQAILEFCQAHPQVAFNAPPDFQPDFVRTTEELGDATAAFKYMRRIFFENRPLVDYLKAIKPGDMCLMFVPGKKFEGLTILARIKGIWKPNDIPPNWKLIIRQTRNFTRYFGDGGLWTSCVAAMTKIRHLRKEMCWRDPDASIFMKKAARHGVAAVEEGMLCRTEMK